MPTMVVTGASSGIGRAIALHFAQRGYTICALARRESVLKDMAARAEGEIQTYCCDVCDKQQVRAVFDSIISDCGRVDVLINNAGGVPARREIDFETIDQVIDTNLKGTMYCTYAVLPSMKRGGGGHIFNIASIAGVYIRDGGSNGLYAAAKHGQVAFGDTLGRMVRKDNVLITNLCPGAVDTPLWTEEMGWPHGRDAMMRPEEIAELIDYVLRQPKRTLFKTLVFVDSVEKW